MEIEKLIKHMREEAQDYRSGRTLGRAFADAEDVLDEAATALEQLQAESDRLKAEVQQTRWIPVEERLPVVQDKYIVTACDEGCPYGEGIWYSTVVVVADYYKGCWAWDDYRCEYDISDIVTHWMPLPQPPKEGTNGKH